MRQLKAVIFDMDGVLVDSEPIHYMIENQLFKRLGLEIPDSLHATYLGIASDLMYEDLKSRYHLTPSVAELMESDDQYRSQYFSELDEVALNAGVPEFLADLKEAGLKIAVATSSTPEIAKVLLERCGIVTMFDTVVTTTDAGKSKPFPDVYLLAAQRLGVSPINCLVFEDSPNGLKAAKNAVMSCIVVQPHTHLDEQLVMADFRIRTFKNLTFNKIEDLFNTFPE